jgi:hypothetical protein
LRREFDGFERRVRSMARADDRVRLLMSAPGVGPIVALTYVSAIDDPARFRSSKDVGAHFGLTPKKYQSGEKDVTGGITKIGDASVRTALYEAAHNILTRPVKGGGLKSWAMKLAKRAGMKKAKVALARLPSCCIACGSMPNASRWTKRSARRVRQPERRGHHDFREGADTSLLDAESRRRDDGSGQAERQTVAVTTTRIQIGRPHPLGPHQVAAMRRPRTEARTGDRTTQGRD